MSTLLQSDAAVSGFTKQEAGGGINICISFFSPPQINYKIGKVCMIVRSEECRVYMANI